MAIQPHNSARDDSAEQTIRMIRLPEVIARTGHSRSVIYEKIKHHEFPQSIALGERAVGFVEHEVNDYLARSIDSSRKASA